MATSVQTTGFKQLIGYMTARKKGMARHASVMIAYGAPYAAAVHENLEARHNPPGIAKYLEIPMRTMTAELDAIVKREAKAGKTFQEALLAAGTRLLEASKAITPVDTGYLRDSGFVRLEQQG